MSCFEDHFASLPLRCGLCSAWNDNEGGRADAGGSQPDEELPAQVRAAASALAQERGVGWPSGSLRSLANALHPVCPAPASGISLRGGCSLSPLCLGGACD